MPDLRQTRDLPLTEKPGETIGRYKLREQIGEGGCGVVYVAQQAEPVRRRVALKSIKLGMETKAELVTLRYFVGMSFEDTPAALGIAVPTAKQWWSYARAWLRVEIARTGQEESMSKFDPYFLPVDCAYVGE